MDSHEKNSLFREKSIERISSPEDLNDYVRVTNPGVWMILIAVVVLLAGFCVWGIFGHLTSTIQAVCVDENGSSVCYIAEDDASRVKAGMSVKIGDGEYTVEAVSGDPVSVDELSEYAQHVGGFEDGEWIAAVSISGGPQDSDVTAAQIVIDDVNPISFVLN